MPKCFTRTRIIIEKCGKLVGSERLYVETFALTQGTMVALPPVRFTAPGILVFSIVYIEFGEGEVVGQGDDQRSLGKLQIKRLLCTVRRLGPILKHLAA